MAVEKVTQFGMQPVEMVKLGKERGVPMWLKVGYTTLVSDVSNRILDPLPSNLISIANGIHTD